MRRTVDDDGFTLVELLVTMAIMAVFAGVAVSALTSWRDRAAIESARDETVSMLRTTATRALSEGRTYCIHFTGANEWTLYRTACDGDPSHELADQGLNSDDAEAAPAFTYAVGLTSSCPEAAACAYFYPRGTASPGTVVVTHPASDESYTVVVEQLTSRVHVQ